MRGGFRHGRLCMVAVWLGIVPACGDGSHPTGPLPATYATFDTIVVRSCSFSRSCHGGDTVRRQSGNLNFAMHAADYREVLVGVTSMESPGLYRLDPGSPDTSYLWHKLDNTQLDPGVCGDGDRMPRLIDEGLPQNELDAIRAWIEAGVPGPDGTPATVDGPAPGYPTGCPPFDAGP